MTTPPPAQRQFFYQLSAELLEIAEADLRLNILVRVDGGDEEESREAEVTNVKVTGMDKDGRNPSLRLEDEEGDEFYIFLDHVISITPVEAFEEEVEDDALEDMDEDEAAEEEA